jgi:hypothetical protein
MKVMPNDSQYHLEVELSLENIGENNFEANVSVAITDTCFKEGELVKGAPSDIGILPENQYLTFYFTHEGKICGDVARTISKEIEVSFEPGMSAVVALVLVNGQLAGSASQPFPDAGRYLHMG